MTVAEATTTTNSQPAPQSKLAKKHSHIDASAQCSSSSTTPLNATVMETLQSLRQQVADQTQDIHQHASNQFEQLRTWLMQFVQKHASTAHEYINRYPPLAAFVFSLLVLSAVPVSIYLIFAVITSAVILTIALIGFSVVEGTMLLAGGGVLLALLGGICLFTLFAFGFISFVYFGYRIGSMAVNQLWQTTNAFTQHSSSLFGQPSSQHQGAGLESCLGVGQQPSSSTPQGMPLMSR